MQKGADWIGCSFDASIPPEFLLKRKSMEVIFEQVGDILVTQICTESLSADNINDFKATCATILRPQSKNVLDMGCIRFIDSSAIGVLLSFARNLLAQDGVLKLCNVTRSVYNLFELVQVQRFLEVFENRVEAIRSFDS
jgi:anti-anti-sigma factor